MTIEFDKTYTGRISFFGGQFDDGVAASEGLALFESVDENRYLFLSEQPPGTTGLARRLNTERNYCAMRWDYNITPKKILIESLAYIKNPKNGKVSVAVPVDFGPSVWTKRIIDASPNVMKELGVQTDDTVEVTLIRLAQLA